MKLKDYIEYLNNIVKEHPEALEMDVYYASDSEGKYFKAEYSYHLYNGFDYDIDGTNCDVIN